MSHARHYTDNSPTTTLPVGINNTLVTFSVASMAGFPAVTPFYAVIDLNQASAEVVEVTTVVGSLVTVTRNANGQGAFSHPANAVFQHAVVAQDLQDSNDHVVADAGVHGVSGNVVGDTDTQTLTNKTLTAPIVTGGLTADTAAIGPNDYGTDTGWLAVSPLLVSGGFTFIPAPGTPGPQYRVKDGRVSFRGAISCNALALTGTAQTCWNIPDGLQPGLQPRYFPIANTAQSARRFAEVTPQGTLALFSDVASTANFYLDTIAYDIDAASL